MAVISYQLPTTHIEGEGMQHNGCLSGAGIAFPSRAPGFTNRYCGVSVAQSLAWNVLQIITCPFVLCVFAIVPSILRNTEGPCGSMSQVVRLPNNSYQPITNTAWVRARLCKLQNGCTRLAAASDKAYQLLGHGRWFSPGIPPLKLGTMIQLKYC